MEDSQLVHDHDLGGAHQRRAAFPCRYDFRAAPSGGLECEGRPLRRIGFPHLLIAAQAPPGDDPGGQGAL